MSDRLKDLERHRAMLQEHLAWLDREIAALAGTPPSPKPSALPPISALPPASALPTAVARAPITSLPRVDERASARAAEQILSQYQTEVQSTATKTKLGCFLYFFIALGLMGGVVLLLYLRTLHKQ
jgi:capsular polysaccharide biosynthesis protein